VIYTGRKRVTYTQSGTFTATSVNAQGLYKYCNVELNDQPQPLQLHQQQRVILTHGLTTGYLHCKRYVYIHFNKCTGMTNTATLNFNQPQYYSTQNTTACDSYTWSANGVTYTASGIIHSYFTNAQGCKTLQTLNLTSTTVQLLHNQQLLVELHLVSNGVSILHGTYTAKR